jgi:hypothetical protein
MRPFLLVLTALLAVAATQARASLQPDIVCIDPDIEFPVACDDED